MNFLSFYRFDLEGIIIDENDLSPELNSIYKLWNLVKKVFGGDVESEKTLEDISIADSFVHHNLLFQLLKAYIYFNHKKYSESLDVISDILRQDTDHPLMGYVYFYRAAISMIQGDEILSHNQFHKALEYFERYQNSVYIMKVYNNIGLYYLNSGEFRKAKEFFELGKQYSSHHKTTATYGQLIYNLGYVHKELFDLQTSVIYIDQSITIFEELGDAGSCGSGHITLGIIFGNQGYLDQSENEFNKAMECFKKIGDDLSIGYIYNNLGLTSQKLGKFTQAKKRFLKSLDIFKKLNKRDVIPNALYNLYMLSLQSNNSEDETYLDELMKYPENGYTQLALAKNLSLTGRIRSISKAMDIYEQLIEQSSSSEIKVISFLELTGILVNEFKTSGSISIISEISELIGKLFNLANTQNSRWIKVQADLLESQLEILKQNLPRAMSILSSAKETSRRYGYSYLELLVTRELDRLSALINELEDNQPNLHEISTSGIHDMLNSLLFQNFERIMVDQEHPILLLIMHHGVSVFSRIFDKELGVHGGLFGNFLSGINDFLNETLKSEYPFDIIKQKNHTILFRGLDEFGLSYVFKGSSYHAHHKLDQFLSKIVSDEELMHEFRTNLSKGLIITEVTSKLDSFVDEIFNVNLENQSLPERNTSS